MAYCNQRIYAAPVQQPEPDRTPEARPTPEQPDPKLTARLFGERVREFREQAELTQQQLSDRLREGFGIKLDTSAITRIESGAREPRLREAIAIAETLGFGLRGLNTPSADLLDYRLNGMNKLIDRAREDLLKLLQAVDRVAEAYQQEHYHLRGYPPLNDVLREELSKLRDEIDWSIARHYAGIFHAARSKDDAEIKREIIEAVSYRIISDDAYSTET